LKKFMDVMKIDKAHLVGLSLGALTISDFMTLYPEKVLSATLASGALSPQIISHEPVKDLKAYKQEWKKSMRKVSYSDNPFLITLINEWRMWQVSHKESAKIFLGNSAKSYYVNNKVQIPVLFIVGDNDSKGSKNAMTEMSKLLPACKIIVIKNAGHFSCMEQPDKFTLAILHFTKTLSKRK